MNLAATIERIRGDEGLIVRLLETDGVQRQGRSWACPFHDDQTPSASVRGGRLHCFVCRGGGKDGGKWWDPLDYVQERYGLTFKDAAALLADMIGVPLDGAQHNLAGKTPPPIPPRAVSANLQTVPKARPELVEALDSCQLALPGSLGEEYLRRRGFSLDLALSLGIGYAAPGQWRGRDWKWGRVVFPHATPEGDIANLYGRAVGADGKVPREIRHDHLRGPKAMFNAAVLHTGSGPLYVCEGAFDALALIAAGHRRTVAIFGVGGMRWEWLDGVDQLVFCLDTDKAGRLARRSLGLEALLRGKRVFYVEARAFGGHKDAASAWRAGMLDVSE